MPQLRILVIVSYLVQHPGDEPVWMQVLRQNAERRKGGGAGLRQEELRLAALGHRHSIPGDHLRSIDLQSNGRVSSKRHTRSPPLYE